MIKSYFFFLFNQLHVFFMLYNLINFTDHFQFNYLDINATLIIYTFIMYFDNIIY